MKRFKIARSRATLYDRSVSLEVLRRELKRKDRELVELRSQLKELGFLKDEFVASVSHELRTPLAILKEGTNLLSDGTLGSLNTQQLDFLNTMNRNIDRLNELIGHLLDLSKLETGSLRLFRKRINVKALIDAVLKGYRPMAGPRTVGLNCPAVKDVFADPDRILQVLGSLFMNAIKFTRENGKIILSIREGDRTVAFSIQDNGVGMAKEELPKLFQKFSRLSEGKRQLRGTGLGLVLCKEVVQLHGGTISVTSKPGKGSTFTFALPAYTPEFALKESFKEQIAFAKRAGAQSLALVVLEVSPLTEELESLAELIRARVHQDDLVLGLEPHWLAILTIAPRNHVESMAQRLRLSLQEYAQAQGRFASDLLLHYGIAFYPEDGSDIHALLSKATASPRYLSLSGRRVA